jgi:RNA polymerase sigma factor (sigma-70 family)
MPDFELMAYDADADDGRLLENGDLDVLLAKYWPVALNRCRARLRGHPDAEDVAQAVMLRLVDEFHRGKRYGGTPYRVVVHKVIGWTISDYFEGRRLDAPLPDEPGTSDDPAEGVVSQMYLETLFDGLAGKDADVGRMRYLRGLEPDQIMVALDMKRDAIDQALWRVRKKLREELQRHA